MAGRWSGDAARTALCAGVRGARPASRSAGVKARLVALADLPQVRGCVSGSKTQRLQYAFHHGEAPRYKLDKEWAEQQLAQRGWELIHLPCGPVSVEQR